MFLIYVLIGIYYTKDKYNIDYEAINTLKSATF